MRLTRVCFEIAGSSLVYVSVIYLHALPGSLVLEDSFVARILNVQALGRPLEPHLTTIPAFHGEDFAFRDRPTKEVRPEVVIRQSQVDVLNIPDCGSTVSFHQYCDVSSIRRGLLL